MTLTHALVATDFSPGATAALSRAAMIARLGNVAQLTVIHVLQHGLLDALRELIGRSEDQQVRRIAEERLRTQVDDLRDAAGVEVTPRLLDGDVRPLIVEETRLMGLRSSSSALMELTMCVGRCSGRPANGSLQRAPLRR